MTSFLSQFRYKFHRDLVVLEPFSRSKEITKALDLLVERRLRALENQRSLVGEGVFGFKGHRV